MIPWFLYLGVRKATSLRQRFVKTEPRRFFSYTVASNHTLIIAIIQVFSLLNPLPICVSAMVGFVYVADVHAVCLCVLLCRCGRVQGPCGWTAFVVDPG